MSRRRIIAAACGLGLAIAACGGETGSDADGDTSSDSAVTTVVEVLPENPQPEADEPDTPDTADTTDTAAAADGVVPALLQFSAPLVGGGEIDAASLAGTPTVFWFWAPT